MSFFSTNGGQRTAFNESEVVAPKPFIEGAGTYNLIPANFRQFTAASGSVAAENRLFKCSTGTSVGGYGALQSFRATPHRAGQGVRARFSGFFSSSVANSWQGIGFLSVGEEMSFGYNGTSFGLWHRYGGLPEVRTITITASASGSETLTLTLNSVAYSIPVTSGTEEYNASEVAAWMNDSTNQSVWGADQLGDTVIFNTLSDGPKSGTYSASSSGTLTGTIAQDTAGVTKTSDFVAQESWNIDTFADLDPSKGNIYQIQYQNMGFGCIVYSVLDGSTGLFREVHRVRWPNTSTSIGIPNPSMRIGLYCVSLGSTTNLNVYASSLSVSVEGIDNRTRNPRGDSNTLSVTTTNETQLLALRNRRTYNGYNNQITIMPLLVSVTNESTRDAIVRIRATTASVTGQVFEAVGSNLVGDTSKNSITYSTGRDLVKEPVEPGGKAVIDLEGLMVNQPPSLLLTITVERVSTGGSNTNFTATINWYEDL